MISHLCSQAASGSIIAPIVLRIIYFTNYLPIHLFIFRREKFFFIQ